METKSPLLLFATYVLNAGVVAIDYPIFLKVIFMIATGLITFFTLANQFDTFVSKVPVWTKKWQGWYTELKLFLFKFKNRKK